MQIFITNKRIILLLMKMLLITPHNFDEATNTHTRSIISGGSWYKDGNDEDVQELDKAVELTKIISLKPPGFLDIVT